MKRIVMIGTIAAMTAVSGLSAMDVINHAGDKLPDKKTMQYLKDYTEVYGLVMNDMTLKRAREKDARAIRPRGNPEVRRRIQF